MQILNPNDYKSHRTSTEGPQLVLTHKGVIILNGATVQLLAIKAGEGVNIAKDDAGDYFISKSIATIGFVVRDYNKTKGVAFNCISLVTEIIKAKDLAIAEDKKKSICFEINTDGEKHGANIFHEIKF